jgi:hypothetical protein
MTFAGGGNSSFVGLGFHRCGGRAFLKGESGRWLGINRLPRPILYTRSMSGHTPAANFRDPPQPYARFKEPQAPP